MVPVEGLLTVRVSFSTVSEWPDAVAVPSLDAATCDITSEVYGPSLGGGGDDATELAAVDDDAVVLEDGAGDEEGLVLEGPAAWEVDGDVETCLCEWWWDVLEAAVGCPPKSPQPETLAATRMPAPQIFQVAEPANLFDTVTLRHRPHSRGERKPAGINLGRIVLSQYKRFVQRARFTGSPGFLMG